MENRTRHLFLHNMKKILIALIMFFLPIVACAAAYPVGVGGTGWINVKIGAILYGNGSSKLSTTSTSVSDYGKVFTLLNGVPTLAATTTFQGTAPVSASFSSGVVTITCTTCATFTYPFPSNATSTQITFNGGLVASNATTTNATSTNSFWSALIAGSNGRFTTLTATATSFAGQSVIPWLTITNSTTTGATTTGLAIVGLPSALLSTNSNGSVISTAVTAPLTFSANTLACNVASLAQPGCLGISDFGLFNNKVSSTSLSGASVISYTSGTGVITTIGGTFGAGSYTFPANVVTTGNATDTNSTSTATSWAGTVAGVNGRFTSLTATGTGAANQSSFQNFTSVNSTSSQATTTNFFALFNFGSIGQFNVLNATSTTIDSSLQGVTIVRSTTTNATTTSIFSGIASSTNLFSQLARIGTLTLPIVSCNTTSALTTDSSGNVLCGAVSGSGGSYSFTTGTNYATTVSATGTSIQTTGSAGVYASGTSHFTNYDYVNATGTAATTTNLFSISVFGSNGQFNVLNATSTTIDSSLQGVSIVRSTTSQATSTNFFALSNFGSVGQFNVLNATSTTLDSSLQGFTAVRSTTTNATATNSFFSLNVFGSVGQFNAVNATSTTVDSTFQGVTIIRSTTTGATTTSFAVSGTASTTFASQISVAAGTSSFSGVNLTSGCFAIAGSCLVTGASSTLLSDLNTFSNLNQFQETIFATQTTAVVRTSLPLVLITSNRPGFYDPITNIGSRSQYQLAIQNTAAVTFGSSTGIALTPNASNAQIGASIIVNSVGSNAQSEFRIYNKKSTTIAVDPTLSFLIDKLGNVAIGTTTPYGRLTILDTFGSQQVLLDISTSTAAAGTATSSIMRVSADGQVLIGTSTVTTGTKKPFFAVGTSTRTYINAGFDGKMGIMGTNNNQSMLSFGEGTNANVNPNVLGLFQDPSDARFGASVADQGVFMKSTGGVYAYDYALGAPRNLILQEFTGALSNVGISTSTPWGKLSVMASSTDSSPQLVFASTTNGIPQLMLSSSPRGSGFFARIAIGTTTLGQGAGSQFNLTVAGSIYSTKKFYACDVVNSIGSQTGDVARLCQGIFDFDEDGNGATLNGAEADGTEYIQLWCGVSAAASALCNIGDGAALTPTNGSGSTNGMGAASSSPSFDAWLSAGNGATSTIYMAGLNAGSTGSDWGSQTLSGYFFIATSTRANWAVSVKDTGGTTVYVDTGVASSSATTGVYQHMHIDVYSTSLTTTRADFYINDILVVSQGTTVSGSFSHLNPFISVGNPTSGGSNGLAKFIKVASLEGWADKVPKQ